MDDGKMTETREQQAGRQELPGLTPRVDVLEDAAGITLYADLPGVSKDALDVKVEGDSLLIEGAISAATPQGMEATYAEIRVSRFRRAFTLSRELDPGRIDAQLKDGVLTLRIPKREEAQPRRIAVKVS
jgi:HSP20 family protein